MFQSVYFTYNPDFYNWDVSGVQSFLDMFQRCSNFNGNVSTWDVSSGSNFSGIFVVASVVQFRIYPLGILRLRQCRVGIGTTGMFESCSAFNQDISNWAFPNLTSLNRILFTLEHLISRYKIGTIPILHKCSQCFTSVTRSIKILGRLN
jgi:hypothetical protein